MDPPPRRDPEWPIPVKTREGAGVLLSGTLPVAIESTVAGSKNHEYY